MADVTEDTAVMAAVEMELDAAMAGDVDGRSPPAKFVACMGMTRCKFLLAFPKLEGELHFKGLSL
jgi:hypothetical protein